MEPAIAPEWVLAVRAALVELDRTIDRRPELEVPARTLGRVLVAAFTAPPALRMPAIPDLDDETSAGFGSILDGWKAGRPAFHGMAPIYESRSLAALALAIARALWADNGSGARALCAALENDPERLASSLVSVLNEDRREFDQTAQQFGVEPALLDSISRLVILPGVAEWSRQVCERLPEGIWPRGDCPICGSEPALAESRGLEQRRRLRCDRCAADWPGEHFRCPFCHTTDHRSLRYVFVEGEKDRVRLSICDQCGGHLKVIATLAPLSPPGLFVAELAAVHLDLMGDHP